MFYTKNLPKWERALRLGVGVAIAVSGALYMDGGLRWILLASGAGFALTGVFGFCPACALLGRRAPGHHAQRRA